MKIGIMLRHYDQHGGGVWVYTRNLLRELLALDTKHEFVLIYRNPKFVGTYSNGGNIREVAIWAPHITLWDQFAVRWVERQEKLDLIFNPKYSIPLTSRVRTVFVSHGLDWYVMPWASKWIDRVNHRFLFPRYARKADAIIAVSNTTRQHLIEYLNLEKSKIHTVYLGVGEEFKKLVLPEKLENVKASYKLPDRFFLYVGQIYPPKNFGRLIKAYAQVGPQMGIHLVVAGEHRWLSGEEIALINQLDLSRWVVRAGWIDHTDLPSFYTLAEVLLMPSLYEACPSPPLEAMACGCPVVTSNRFGTKEIAGDAAILVDPENIGSIAQGIRTIVTDLSHRQSLIEAGHNRVNNFSWEKCAQDTLKVLEIVLSQPI
jgi:glycosyltransferase involved in cell wall biosynthesis